MSELSKEFWSKRYSDNKTGWDLGEVSPPIKAYFEQVEDRSIKILIPGCGNAYEAEYLFNSGFKNVNVIDLAAAPLQNLRGRVELFPEDQTHQGNFFDHEGAYDLIVEQTMFCAIDPTLRQAYADKVYDLLVPGGKLIGLLFNRDFEGGPPFGGSVEEYLGYFKTKFSKVDITPCYNSYPPRQGAEVFINLVK